MVVCTGLLFLLNTAGGESAQICQSNQEYSTGSTNEPAAYSSQSRTCGSPCPPPGFPEIRAQTRSVRGHRFSCHTEPNTCESEQWRRPRLCHVSSCKTDQEKGKNSPVKLRRTTLTISLRQRRAKPSPWKQTTVMRVFS